MTQRTIRERLAATTAPPAVGTLVRCVNEDSSFWGMSGKIVYHDRFLLGVVGVQMTSTGHVLSFGLRELEPVERGE